MKRRIVKSLILNFIIKHAYLKCSLLIYALSSSAEKNIDRALTVNKYYYINSTHNQISYT